MGIDLHNSVNLTGKESNEEQLFLQVPIPVFYSHSHSHFPGILVTCSNGCIVSTAIDHDHLSSRFGQCLSDIKVAVSKIWSSRA